MITSDEIKAVVRWAVSFAVAGFAMAFLITWLKAPCNPDWFWIEWVAAHYWPTITVGFVAGGALRWWTR